jgi:hypothetical protein
VREGDCSIAQAAEIAGVSRDTIKRRLNQGAFPGAFRGHGGGPGGPWRIPISDMHDAGLVRQSSDAAADMAQLGDHECRIQLAVARAEIRLLNAHLADLRRLLVSNARTS